MKRNSQNTSPCKPEEFKTLRGGRHSGLPELMRLFTAMQAERGQLAQVNIPKINAPFAAGTMGNGSVYRDRAATATTGVIQIIQTAPACDLRQHIEALLRDEFADLTQQIMSERDGFDE